MAAQKPTVIFSLAFSTLHDACGIDHVIREAAAALDRAEQNAEFQRIYGMTRQDWDTALSLHLHGDLQ
jgi:hypothetical protein